MQILLPGKEETGSLGTFKPRSDVTMGNSQSRYLSLCWTGTREAPSALGTSRCSSVFPCSNMFTGWRDILEEVALPCARARVTQPEDSWPPAHPQYSTVPLGMPWEGSAGLCHGAVPSPASKHRACGIASHEVCAWGHHAQGILSHGDKQIYLSTYLPEKPFCVYRRD